MPGERVAVITGASSGIGEATARLLARERVELRPARAAGRPTRGAREGGRRRVGAVRRARPRAGRRGGRSRARAPSGDRPAREQRGRPRPRHVRLDVARDGRARPRDELPTGASGARAPFFPGYGRQQRRATRTSSTSSRSPARSRSRRPARTRRRSTRSSRSRARSPPRCDPRGSSCTRCSPVSSRRRGSSRGRRSRAASCAGSSRLGGRGPSDREAVRRGRRELTVPWFPYRPVSIFQAVFPGVLARLVGRYGYRPGVHD